MNNRKSRSELITEAEQQLSFVEMQIRVLYAGKRQIEDKLKFFKSEKYQEWNSQLDKDLDSRKPYKEN